jgi:hypothetical protein
MKFNVTYIDGTKVDVTARPVTEVAYERKFGRPLAAMFAGLDLSKGTSDLTNGMAFLAALPADDLYFLAWHAARSDKTYDDWLELVDEIGWDMASMVDPTQPAAPAGS